MILNNYFQQFQYHEKHKKSKKVLPYIVKFSEYKFLLEYKYTIKDFQCILRRLQLPRCKKTKRKDIQTFCTNMLYLSHNISKIQKSWRNYFIREFNQSLGPSYKNYKISNNLDDFLTTEKIQDINYYYCV